MATRLAGSLASLGSAPVPMPPSTVPPYTAPSTPTFGGAPPAPTPMGAFTSLDPSTFDRTPQSMFLQGEQQKAIQRGAAARGTLLTGGLQKRLQENAVGLAGSDFGAANQRAMDAYNTNRATNAQNFNQGMDSFTGSLSGFNANAGAGLNYGRLAEDAQAQAYGQARTGAMDARGNLQDVNDYNAEKTMVSSQQAAADYARQVAHAREVAASQPHGGASTVYDQQRGRDLVARAAPLVPYSLGGALSTPRLGR